MLVGSYNQSYVRKLQLTQRRSYSGINVPLVFSFVLVIQEYDERYPAPLLYKARARNYTKLAANGSNG